MSEPDDAAPIEDPEPLEPHDSAPEADDADDPYQPL
jgi:hypothetical protein